MKNVIVILVLLSSTPLLSQQDETRNIKLYADTIYFQVDSLALFDSPVRFNETILDSNGNTGKPGQHLTVDSIGLVNWENTETNIKQVSGYAELRQTLTGEIDSIIVVKDSTYTYNNVFTGLDEIHTTIGGVFYKTKSGTENGGITIVADDGTIWKREWDGINVYPDWWVVGGYDEDGNIYENDFRQRGIQCDYDRVVASNEFFENDSRSMNINLPNDRMYLQYNKSFSTFDNVTIHGNGATIKRANWKTTLTTQANIGDTQYQVVDASKFRIGNRASGFFGTENSQHDRTIPSQSNLITAISGNTITVNLPIQNVIPSGSAFQKIGTQMGYGNNVTINNLIFDGNKQENDATESWVFVNCLKSTISTGLVLNDCEFYNMPSDCVTTAGETWVHGGIAKNLNACVLHGSSGNLGAYSDYGVYVNDFKADSICLSTGEANGHASYHGFYTQSIGTKGIKINNCRITNVINGGIIAPLTSQSDGFSLTNSYFENCSFITVNGSNNDIIDLIIDNNQILDCGLTGIGGTIGASTVYNRFKLTNNIIRNSIFHVAGVTDGIISNNNWRLEQTANHTDFTNTEISSTNASYRGILHVHGRNNQITNNIFTSTYVDPDYITAISYAAPGTSLTNQGLTISNNKITDFSQAIFSANGSTVTNRSGINISNNSIRILDGSIGSAAIRTFFNATVTNNDIVNTNAMRSIHVYGNLEDPLVNIGCKVTGNVITGSTFTRMIDVTYRNNIIEGNIITGGIGYINAAFKATNIVGNNRVVDITNRTIATDEYIIFEDTFPTTGVGVENGSQFKGTDGALYYKSDAGTVTQIAPN